MILKEHRVRASADLGLVRGEPECTVQALAGFCRKFSFKEVPLGSSTESEVVEG